MVMERMVLQLKKKQERDIAQILQKYDCEVHPVGENLPEQAHIHRVKVVTAFLKAGVPLSKINCFRQLLEEDALIKPHKLPALAGASSLNSLR